MSGPDETLMLEFQRGSCAAFDELFARYRNPLYGFFQRRLLTAARAEDLMQETFLAVIRAASNYEPKATFRTYLYAIAMKLLFAERRKQARTGLAQPPELGAFHEPDATLWVDCCSRGSRLLESARSLGSRSAESKSSTLPQFHESRRTKFDIAQDTA